MEQAVGKQVAGERAAEKDAMTKKVPAEKDVLVVGQAQEAFARLQRHLKRGAVVAPVAAQQFVAFAKDVFDCGMPDAVLRELVKRQAEVAGDHDAKRQGDGEDAQRWEMPLGASRQPRARPPSMAQSRILVPHTPFGCPPRHSNRVPARQRHGRSGPAGATRPVQRASATLPPAGRA